MHCMAVRRLLLLSFTFKVCATIYDVDGEWYRAIIGHVITDIEVEVSSHCILVLNAKGCKGMGEWEGHSGKMLLQRAYIAIFVQSG